MTIEVTKFNPSHDPGTGEFSSGGGVQNEDKPVVERTFYHGSNPGSSEKIDTGIPDWDKHFFVADAPKHALNYGHHLDEYEFKPGSRVLVEGTKEFNQVGGGKWKKGESMLDYSHRVVQNAEAKGYDAVYFNLQGTIGTVVINRSSLVQKVSKFNP